MTQFCPQCGKPAIPNAAFCTQCGAALGTKTRPPDSWQKKREKVLGRSTAGRRHWVKPAALVALFAAAFVWVYLHVPEGGNPIVKAQPIVVEPVKYSPLGQQMFDIPARVENGKIIVPLDVLKARRFIGFKYESPVNSVPLLAYVTTEGKIVTAVSMCEPCNSSRFHIRSEELVCNSCGSTWELNTLEAVSGSCGRYPPDAVPNAVVGNEVQIDEQVIARWQRRI